MIRSPHIHAAHHLWQSIVRPHDIVIDATCGHGHDTLVLSQLLSTGKIYAFDIQEIAIQNTKEKLKDSSIALEFINASHATFPPQIQSVRLIVYNLGYLPGNNKNITTMTESTLQSIHNGFSLLLPGGALSIMLYPGHAEGKRESESVLELANTLPNCQINHFTWGTNPNSPSLLWIHKNDYNP